MGQGTFTTLPVIIAEELDADWAKVRPIFPSDWDDKKFGNPSYNQAFQTSASASVWGYYTPLRIAGAQARRVLLDAVAEKWGVPVGELSTEPSVVVHKASGRRIGYGEIAAFAKAPAEMPKIEEKDLKPTSSFRLIGKDIARVELPLKVTGAAKYAMDAQVPGMVYAAVLQSPYAGGAPLTVDDTRARKVPGVTDIVKLPDGVGVIGTTVEGTQAAKNLLKVTWGDAPGAHLDSESALEEFAAIGRDKSRDGVPYEKAGDAKAAMASAKRVFRGEYRTRYVYHAQMEPMNATASVASDGKSAELWVGTQAATSLLNGVAKLLQTDRSKLVLHQNFLGGGFGRRGNHEVVYDAVRLSKAVGKPVKLIWTREDDVTFGKFRPMTAHHIEAGFDAGGKLVAWHHRVISESVVAYVSGDPKPRPDRIVMKGSPVPQYPVPNKLAEHVIENRGARLSPWRGVGNGHNAFAVESFVDEMAKDLGKDPVAFRLEITDGVPRMQHLLRVVAEMSDWKRKREGTRTRHRHHGQGRHAGGGRRRGVDRPQERQDQGAQFLGRARRRHRRAAEKPRGADRGQRHLRARPRAARKDRHQGRPRGAVELQRLRGRAHVGRAQHRDQGGLDRQQADRRRRGRRAAGRVRGRQRHRGAHRRTAARAAVLAGARARRVGGVNFPLPLQGLQGEG